MAKTVARKTSARARKTHLASLPTVGMATILDVADALGVSKDTIRRECLDGKIPSLRIRDTIRIPWSAVHKILEGVK